MSNSVVGNFGTFHNSLFVIIYLSTKFLCAHTQYLLDVFDFFQFEYDDMIVSVNICTLNKSSHNIIEGYNWLMCIVTMWRQYMTTHVAFSNTKIIMHAIASRYDPFPD